MPERIDLRSIRESKGITIDKVFEDTKIPKRVIVALETGDFSDLFLSPVYVKGFAKTYARYLGLDPEKVVRSVFPEEYFEESKVKEEKETSPSKRSYPVKQIFCMVKDWMIFIFSLIISFLIKIPRRIYMGLVIVFLGVFFVLSVFHKQVSNEMDNTTSTSRETKSGKNWENQVPISKKSAPEENTLKESAVPIRKDKFSIFVQATDDCWMRVKADGEQLFVGVLRKGDIENWSAKDEISLWVGNAGALKIRCGEKTYNRIGRKGQVIKDIVFSSDCSYHIRRR